MQNVNNFDTICAISTPSGMGGIAVIRVSGNQSIKIVDKIFKAKNCKKLYDAKSNNVIFGQIINCQQSIDNYIDEVLTSVFRAPHSYTGENIVEISCHGSIYIQQEILKILIENGCRLANAGEFTQRAFLNGKMDLSQAEAVSDIINSNSKAAHRLSQQQYRKGISLKIKQLRKQLLHLSSLLELELDFAEEDVKFADREQLNALLQEIDAEIEQLLNSFKAGNSIKNGVPVAIIGKPNVGKSSLLNLLINDDRAIVSEIPGTTRDTIEETTNIAGVDFRFIDTAGIRNTKDVVEKLGIERSFQSAQKADIILVMTENNNMEDIDEVLKNIDLENKKIIIVNNKIDLYQLSESKFTKLKDCQFFFTQGSKPLIHTTIIINISAKNNIGIEAIISELENYAKMLTSNSIILSNLRHYEALYTAKSHLKKIEEGYNIGLPSDIIAIDVKYVLYHLGEITGEITTDEVLNNIFGKFCIGK